MEPLTPEYTQQTLQKIISLPDDADRAVIEETAQRLRSLNWQPILLSEPPDFLTITKPGIEQFIATLVNDGKPHSRQELSLLAYHFRLLQQLRANVPEAWDEVNELMDDD